MGLSDWLKRRFDSGPGPEDRFRNPPLSWPPDSGTGRRRGWSLLDIRMLLAIMGILVLVALVMWLWVDEPLTPPIIAILLVVVNAGMLAAGWWVLNTPNRWVGLAITLLACLAMPLHLMYYQANQLNQFNWVADNFSGRLFVAALVIGVLYASSAFRVLTAALGNESVIVDEQGVTHYHGFGVSRVEWHQVVEVAAEWPEIPSLPFAPLPEVIITGDNAKLIIHSAICHGLPALLVGLAALPGFPGEEFCRALNRRDSFEEEVFWRRNAADRDAAPERSGT